MGRLGAGADPWDRPVEVVPLDLVDQVVGPDGPEAPGDARKRADCPAVPELTRTWPAPGSRSAGSPQPVDG